MYNQSVNPDFLMFNLLQCSLAVCVINRNIILLGAMEKFCVPLWFDWVTVALKNILGKFYLTMITE